MNLALESRGHSGGPDDIYARISARLGEDGWCVTPDFVPPLLVTQLAGEAREAWAEGRFRHAGVGRGDSFEVKPEVRSDRVMWIEGAESGALGVYLGMLEQLRQAINGSLWLGLFELEGHYALYPPGTYYRKHLDQFRGIGTRTVTAILYLNEGWVTADGGQLRMYIDQEDPSRYLDIEPQAGKLVTFLSARFLHEVLPATRERLSITAWFKRRGEG